MKSIPLRVAAFLVTFLVFIYSFAANKDEPLVIVQDGKYGYIDHEGKILIRPQFVWADDFFQGMGTAYVCGRYVSVDLSGNLLPLRSAAPGRLEPKRKGGKIGFVDSSGGFAITPIFDEALPFSDGYAAVRIRNKWGFIDKTGREVIGSRFEAAFYFREGVGTALLPNDRHVLIDTSGKIVAQGYTFLMGIVAEGRVPATRGKKSGYLDLKGNESVPFIYDQVDTFSEGLAAVKKDDKWQYIDRDGKVAISIRYDMAGPFANELAPAKLGDISGFIDKSGKFSFRLDFKYAPGFLTGNEEGVLVAPSDVSRFWTNDGRFGIVNISGKVIWGPAKESPDHAPLFMTDELKDRSFDGFPEEIKQKIKTFP